ncbi:hypothetical protein HPULCUR_009852 [Helicostylum pulchrum]|uniref:BZIP domain-containing protein n=1 Tax=Helicostylum pulchrum TaxID=562976 RepID=A0ABP9YBM6_9FUNG
MASPQQLIDNPTKANNNSVFDSSQEGLYNGSYPYAISPKQQHNTDSHKWAEYSNDMIVTPDMFIHSDVPPLVNSQHFENMYKHSIPNFQQEPRFNFSQHRGSLQTVHTPGGSGDQFHFNNNLPNTLNDNMVPVSNAATYLRRYTEGAIPRQRKKQWLANLQHRVEYLSTDNEQLQAQATLLREEVLNLKTLLLAHRDCKVAQDNGVTMNMIQSVSSSTLQYNNAIPPSPVTNNSHHLQQQQLQQQHQQQQQQQQQYKHPTDL